MNLFFLLRKLWICLWLKIWSKLCCLWSFKSISSTHVNSPLNWIAYSLKLILAYRMTIELCSIVRPIYWFCLFIQYAFISIVAWWLVCRWAIVTNKVRIYRFWFWFLSRRITKPIIYSWCKLLVLPLFAILAVYWYLVLIIYWVTLFKLIIIWRFVLNIIIMYIALLLLMILLVWKSRMLKYCLGI